MLSNAATEAARTICNFLKLKFTYLTLRPSLISKHAILFIHSSCHSFCYFRPVLDENTYFFKMMALHRK